MHPLVSDPKYTGTREQDMTEEKKKEAAPEKEEGTSVAETEENGSQWLNRPLSKSEIEQGKWL
jgi:hypothetical protein